jgi:hypothetical protein
MVRGVEVGHPWGSKGVAGELLGTEFRPYSGIWTSATADRQGNRMICFEQT